MSKPRSKKKMSEDRRDTWCVIGAGPSGLMAGRSLKHAGIPFEIYERFGDVGGIWEIENPGSPMYDSAHFISSRTQSNIPGFPFPDNYPDYPGHRLILEYIKSFARSYNLYEHIRFNQSVDHVEREGDFWSVRLKNGRTLVYGGLFICNGNTWSPNRPDYGSGFRGRAMHSVEYRSSDIFKGKRVLVVGAGNSGCDIACDAARNADAAFISLRRGYHVIPKHIMGQPADAFGSRFNLPVWLERPIFSTLLKLVVGPPTNYGLPAPDHRVLESHPIVNSQILESLTHGDLTVKPDIREMKGKIITFQDGSEEKIDLIIYATGFKVDFPFMDRKYFTWLEKYPDLFLSAIHPQYDNLCVLGIHQTNGSAYDFFNTAADIMVNFIHDQRERPEKASEFRHLKKSKPDLRGGMKYVSSPRHETYVRRADYIRYTDRLIKSMGWKRFGSMYPPAQSSPVGSRAR